jgi:putative two-component system response regulator
MRFTVISDREYERDPDRDLDRMSPFEYPVQRRSRVLVADDTDSVRSLFQKLLSADGHDVTVASDGAAALDAVQRHQPDVILLDVTMPVMDGLEVCRRLKADAATRLTPIVLITGQTDLSDRLRGIEAGADEFLSKPVHPHELRARVRSLTRMKHLIDALDSAEAAFITLALTIEGRDPLKTGHCERLGRYAVRVGQAMGLDDEDIQALHRGGYMHDVGNVGVPDAVLLKPGPLTPDEVDVMRRHTEIGDSLCAPLQSLRRVRPIVRCHHERLDGSGYPSGLRGDDIPLLAQIIGVVDVYDAITSERPYRTAASSSDAAQYLTTAAGEGKFDHRLVEAFLDTLVAEPAASGHVM